MNKTKKIIIVLTFIALLAIVFFSLKIKSENKKTTNGFLLPKLNSLLVEDVKDVTIIYLKDTSKGMKIITDKESIKKILESLKALDISKNNAKIDNQIDSYNNEIYNIVINEEKYYPESPIIITEQYIYYNGYNYYVGSEKIKDIMNIMESIT